MTNKVFYTVIGLPELPNSKKGKTNDDVRTSISDDSKRVCVLYKPQWSWPDIWKCLSKRWREFVF